MRWKWIFLFVVLTVVCVGACLIGPNRPCGSSGLPECERGYVCVSNWCVPAKAAESVTSSDGGGNTAD